MRHLKKCREMEGGAALVVDMKKDKAATGSITKAIRRSASVPLAVKNSAGEVPFRFIMHWLNTFCNASYIFAKVVYQRGLRGDGREEAKIAIARTIMYSSHHVSDRFFNCPFNKDQQRQMYRAGYEAAMRAKRGTAVDLQDFPTLNRANINPYIQGR